MKRGKMKLKKHFILPFYCVVESPLYLQHIYLVCIIKVEVITIDQIYRSDNVKTRYYYYFSRIEKTNDVK